MGLIYKPFGIVLGIAAALLGKKLFEFVWTQIDDEEPPEPTTEETSWPKLLIVATVQGAIFRVTRATRGPLRRDRWRYLTGTWPGEQRPDPDD